MNSREGKKTYFHSLVYLKQNFIGNNDSSTGKFSENWNLRNSCPQVLGFWGNLWQCTGCLQCKQRSQDPKTHKHHFIQTSRFWRENMGNYFVLWRCFSISKLGKEYVKAVYCHPAYITSMQNNHAKCQGGWIITWNQDCWD